MKDTKMSHTLAVSATDQNHTFDPSNTNNTSQLQNGRQQHVIGPNAALAHNNGSISPQITATATTPTTSTTSTTSHHQLNHNHHTHNHHIVKAQLPNQQRTTVSIPTGMTIKEALCKALKLRKLEPDMCTVYKLSPQSPHQKQRIEWDLDVAMLKGDEILVETKDRVPMHTQLSHNFAKSFLTLSKCVFCQEFLMIGIRCLTCGIEFHKSCSDNVPQLCEPYTSAHDPNYYRYLLARSNGFSSISTNTTLANISESSQNTIPNRLIRPRARSADENSKHKSKSISHHHQQQDQQQNSSIDNTTNNNNNNNNSTANGSNNSNNLNNNYNNTNNNNQQFSANSTNISNYQHHSPYESTSPYSTNHHHHPHYNHTPSPTKSSGNHYHQLHLGTNNNNPTSSTRDQQLSPSTQQPANRELLEEKWEIDGNDVTKLRRIGQGSFATVYEGIWHGKVALKELNVKNPSPAQLQGFKNEVLVLKRTRHKNILLFLGYVLKPNLLIVTQLCKGCSLYKHLHVKEVSFSNSQIMTLAKGVALGMEYLHAKNILHRDLKSNNIFIQDENFNIDQIKIGDFGLATFKTSYLGDQQIYHPTGSILWMAPEVIKTKPGHNPFTYKSDVYSFGIVLYELLSRKLPYFDFKYKEALIFLIGLGDPEKLPKLNLDVIGPDKPEGLKTLMLNCIQRNPESRPLFTSIVKHLKKIKLLRSTSEPLRLNDLDGFLGSDPMNY